MTEWIMFFVLVALVLVWFVGALFLQGTDLQPFDSPTNLGNGANHAYWQRVASSNTPNAEHQAVLASLAGITNLLQETPRAQHLGVLRRYMDDMAKDRHFAVQFTPVNVVGMAAEWVQAPGADSSRRTLYIHGGAWMMGSPRSHRAITARFAEITGGAVLAIDYRLMPEHPRKAGIEDCRRAYCWMLVHGPNTLEAASAVFVAGDSAGGNLALGLMAWVRDQRLRAPDAVVALSPATDGTLDSPSLRTNLATDPMLGPLFGRLIWVPRSALLWLSWLINRIRPNHPLVSPIFGDLSGLPPTLIQASDCEMLRDDSVRYTHKARAAGSPVTLQTWDRMVHVWHIFDPDLSEARQGFEEIRSFLERVCPAGCGSK